MRSKTYWDWSKPRGERQRKAWEWLVKKHGPIQEMTIDKWGVSYMTERLNMDPRTVATGRHGWHEVEGTS